MSEEATAALDGGENQVSAEAVEQEQAQQGAEEASEEAGDGSAEAGQDADGV